jgi:cold-inducible RNA-binding protein
LYLTRRMIANGDFMLVLDWLPTAAGDHSPQKDSGKEQVMNIYVGNLSYDTQNDDLKTAFEQFGQVDDARVVEDRETGRSRGFGFVEMADESAARKAIEEMNGVDLQGRTITVNEARPREDRGGGGRGGGGRGRY